MDNCYYCLEKPATIFKETRQRFSIKRDELTNKAQFCSENCAKNWKGYGHKFTDESCCNWAYCGGPADHVVYSKRMDCNFNYCDKHFKEQNGEK